jgi:AraC family transcriptional regulator
LSAIEAAIRLKSIRVGHRGVAHAKGLPEMLLLRSLPDLAPCDAEFHDSLRAKCIRDNCIIWGRARSAQFGPYPESLSIRAVWGGTQHCHLSNRTVAIDDDSFLILNSGTSYSTSIRATSPVESLTVCFQPGMVESVSVDLDASIEQALAHGGSEAPHSLEFIENLQAHEGTVSPVLRFIRAHLLRGLVDEEWYEEQLVFLLERMIGRQRKVLQEIDQLALIRPTTRREVHRRVSLATDFLLTHYVEGVDLSTLAGMAYLSKFHFLRLFRLIHGMTPRAYLQRKRLSVALRLLATTRLSIKEVAAAVGFAYESTLQRHVRSRTQLTPRQIRGSKAYAFAIQAS